MEEIKRGFHRGDIWYSNLSEYGIENHLVLLIGNWKSCIKANELNAIFITSKNKNFKEVHVELDGYGLNMPSIVKTEKIFTISKDKLLYKIGHVSKIKMFEVDEALKKQLQLTEQYNNLDASELEKLFLENNNKIEDEKIKLEKLKNDLFSSYSNKNICETITLSNQLIESAKKSKIIDKNEYIWYAYYVKAVTHLDDNQIAESMEYAQKSLTYVYKPQSFSKSYGNTLWLIARLNEKLKKNEEAIKIYKILLKYYKNSFDNYKRIACCFNLAILCKSKKAMTKIYEIMENTKPSNKNWYNSEENKKELLNEMKSEIETIVF